MDFSRIKILRNYKNLLFGYYGGLKMLKYLCIKNFRSFKDFRINFNKDLNIIIGQNDAGKTSLILALKTVFGFYKADKNDFNDFNSNMIISVEDEDASYLFESEYSHEDEKVSSSNKFKLSNNKITEIDLYLDSEDFEELSSENKKDKLIEFCKIFNVSCQKRWNLETLFEKVKSALDSAEYLDYSSKYPISFLDGKHFENLVSFFDDTFFKEIKSDIWNKDVGGNSFNELLQETIDEYKEEQLGSDSSELLNDKLKQFFPNFEKIDLNVTTVPKLNLEIDVKILNKDGSTVFHEKMGDGTKRRTTMALFEHKTDKNDLCYVFDEPDTHLHIKAQQDIYNIFQELYAERNKQVFITTHSPFLINTVKPKHLHYLFLNSENQSKLLDVDSENLEELLNELGVNNSDLFFTNKILVVEGETEELFLPKIYDKVYERPFSYNLVKILKAEGIQDVPRFVRVIKEFFKGTDIHIFVDNDAPTKTENLLKKIEDENIACNIIKIGTNEFEDSFSDEILATSLNKYISDILDEEKIYINAEEVKNVRDNGKKFSSELNVLISQHVNGKLSKTLFSQCLVDSCSKNDIPEDISTLFSSISN